VIKTKVALGAALILALLSAGPASAYLNKIGLRISTDVFYSLQSGSSYFGPDNTRDIRQPDLTTFTAQADTQLYVLWLSNDRTVGVHLQIQMSAGPNHGVSQVELYYLYAWYKFGRCRLEIGHTDNLFASAAYAPYGALGFSRFGDGSGGFFDFGKLYSGRFVQMALYWSDGPWRLMIALGAARANSDNRPALAGGIDVVQVNTRYPRIDLALEYKGRWFAVAPGLAVYRAEWEPMAGTPHMRDQEIVSWALVLPFKFSLGPAGLTGEIGIGQNWVTSNMLNTWQFASWWGGLGDGGNLDKVADTRMYSACLGIYYRLGRTTLWLSAGIITLQNPSSDAPGAWRHGMNQRYAVVLAAPYQVTRHLTIAPEVGYYFFGWNPTQDVGYTDPANGAPASTTADLGSAWIMGVRFQISF
jgi:hypothetical protein